MLHNDNEINKNNDEFINIEVNEDEIRSKKNKEIDDLLNKLKHTYNNLNKANKSKLYNKLNSTNLSKFSDISNSGLTNISNLNKTGISYKNYRKLKTPFDLKLKKLKSSDSQKFSKLNESFYDIYGDPGFLKNTHNALSKHL